MELTVTTQRKRQIIDITDAVAGQLGEQASGLVGLTVLHTTAALTTADLDPGTDLDLLDFLERLTPQAHWRHPHNPTHAPDHLLASLIGPSVVLPVQRGQLVLGAWQRIILVELDGPRERKVAIALAG